MASFFLNQQPLTFVVTVQGSVLTSKITFPVVLTGHIGRKITGTITVPFKLVQSHKITGTILIAPVMLVDLRTHRVAGGSGLVTYNNVIGVPVVLSQRLTIGGGATGTQGQKAINVPFHVNQTVLLNGTITSPMVLTGAVNPPGLLRSPALVHFDGTNFIKRSVGSGTGDNDLHGQAAFTAAIVFDPELIHLGQSCTVVAKDNGSTQRAWRVEWDATTGNATVTVCASANGTNRSSRTTTAVIRTRSILAFTWDSTNLHLYVNGTLGEGAQTDVGTPGAMATCTEPLSFGAHNPSGGGTNPMKGAVYMLAVFNVALSGVNVAKIGADCSMTEDIRTSANLRVIWHPDQVASNLTHAQFYTWVDQKYGLGLFPGFVSGGNLPDIIPSSPLGPRCRRNIWDINFVDTGVRPQNLTSTYALSSSQPIRRLYTGAATVPNVAAGSNWRRFKNDVTILLSAYKQIGTTTVVVARCYGFELLYNQITFTLFANVGVDVSATLQNTRYTFPIGGIPGFGEGQTVTAVVRYNSSADRVDVIVNGVTLQGATSATNSFSNGTGLTLSDQLDYIRAVALPASLSDSSVADIFNAFNPAGDSFNDGQYYRSLPNGFQDGLSQLYPNYFYEFPTNPDPPPAIGLPEFDSVPMNEILLPSLLDGTEYLQFPYVDEPYPVREGETLQAGTEVDVIYGDPLPSVVSVTTTVTHQVTAIANAGPTDAGQVISWWEIEYEDGNDETFIQIDYNLDNDFSTNRTQTDTFTIPLGLDYRLKRIRFVIQAVADAAQIWKSLYIRLPNDDAFDNNPPDTVIVPGPEIPSPPTAGDLEITLTQQALILKKAQARASLTLQIAANSRYKLTRPFIDSALDRGVEFELMSVLDDFYQAGSEFKIHRVRKVDIGFLDRLAVDYFGAGNESLWWAIAYSNAIVDPERDMVVGQALVIPSRDAIQSFLSRRPVR